MSQNNPANPVRPRYASLTAGLLARKGEAVPAAASFSPDAMSQHLPARRLAQESRASNFSSEKQDKEIKIVQEDDPTAGPLVSRAAFIEDAIGNENHEVDPKKDASRDTKEGDSDQSLGLSKLVDRAIASVERQNFGRTSVDLETGKDETSSCDQTRKDFVGSIRKTALIEGSAGTALHLDPRRFIRLQVAAMKLDVSKQELMAAALDSFLDTLLEDVFSECSCMQKGLI